MGDKGYELSQLGVKTPRAAVHLRSLEPSGMILSPSRSADLRSIETSGVSGGRVERTPREQGSECGCPGDCNNSNSAIQSM